MNIKGMKGAGYMRTWEGMERFLQLSLGSQVGASGVALIAVIELKQMVQQQVGFQGPSRSNSVKLTAEEWRMIAGIYERKTFERAKARLEELGVLHIGRDRKLLEITLWPDQIPLKENPTCGTEGEVASISREGENETNPVTTSKTGSVAVSKTSSPGMSVPELSLPEIGLPTGVNSEVQLDLERTLATNRVKGRKLRLLKDPKERSEPFDRTDDGKFSGTKLGTCQGTFCETDVETSYGTGCETDVGTSLGTTSETVPVSLSKRILLTREEVVFPSQDVPESVDSLKCVDNSLHRYSLNRYSLNYQYYNGSNDITNNDQRNNQCNNGKRNNDEHNNLQQSDRKQNNKQANTNLSEQRTILREPESGVHASEEMRPSPEFASLWVQEAGHPLTSYEKEGLARFHRLGYTEELFVEALRCAVAADNRRMGYVLGILRNWYQEGVRFVGDVALAKKRWEDLRFLKRAKIG